MRSFGFSKYFFSITWALMWMTPLGRNMKRNWSYMHFLSNYFHPDRGCISSLLQLRDFCENSAVAEGKLVSNSEMSKAIRFAVLAYSARSRTSLKGRSVYAFGHCIALIFPETSLLLVAFGHISKQGSLSMLSSSGGEGRTPNLNCQSSCPTRKKKKIKVD